MKIGIFGTGIVGRTLGGALAEAGHEVMIGTRNVEETMARAEPEGQGSPAFSVWLEKQEHAEIGTFKSAAAHGELLINATAGTVSLDVLESAGADNLGNKILVDVSNPLDFTEGFPPTLAVCNTDSVGEQIQREYPELNVVKTLNTLTSHLMVNPGLVPGDHSIFVSGNDEKARAAVSGYLVEWFGWKPGNIIDLGDITTARGTEMLLPLWVRLYGKFGHPFFNVQIVQGKKP